jgi:predicted nucleotidyltransferase
VTSLPWLVGLKLFAWADRQAYKDLDDLAFMLQYASEVVDERIYDEIVPNELIFEARDRGIDLEVVANRAGQDPKVTASIYNHVPEARKKKAALSVRDLIYPFITRGQKLVAAKWQPTSVF